MTEKEKKDRIKILVEELVTFDVKEERESQIFLEVNKLSPDPQWSDYIFWSDDYLDDDGKLLMEKFLDKIFSYQPIIMGYTPTIDTEENEENLK